MMLSPVPISKHYVHCSIACLTDVCSATTPAAIKPQTSKKVPVSQAPLSLAYQSMPEQGTTQQNPVNIEDDDSNEEDNDCMDEDLELNYNKLVTEVMSQELPEKQKTPPTKDQAQSRFVLNHKSSTQQSLDHMRNTHPDLELRPQERAMRKPNIVGFDAHGPRNQGSRQQKKPSSLAVLDPPFEEASSPDVEPLMIQEPPAPFFATSGPHADSKEVLDFDVPEVQAHIDTVADLISTTSGDVATVKLMSTSVQLRKTSVAVDIPAAGVTNLTESESLAKSVKIGPEETKSRLIEGPAGDKLLNERHRGVEPRTQSQFVEQELSQQLSNNHGDSHDKLLRNAHLTQTPATLIKDKTALRFDISTNLNLVNPMQPVSREHTQASPNQSGARPQVVQPQHVDKSSKTSGFKASRLPAEQSRAEIQSQLHRTTLPANDRKRPSIEMAGEAAKRLKADAHVSRTPAAAKNSVFRRLSQINDNGSPMPHGGETSQGTALVLQTRQEKIPVASTPPPFALSKSVNESSTRPTVFVRNAASRVESPFKELRAPHEDSSLQVSRPISQAGFDEDTQVTADYPQTFGLRADVPKHVSPVPSRSAPRGAPPRQNTVGLVEALWSKVAHQTDAPGTEADNGKESPESEKPMEDEDPDKTLVNEDSGDEDNSDDDGSGSRNSSDTDGDDIAKSALSKWRHALESHQGDVYDQLVRIAHRLTNHLKDHETAIKDINTDYSQDGMKLIQRLVSDNEAKLEQYRTKQSKIQGASVLGCDQVRGSLYNDMKDVKASHERFVKTLQKQVNAVGRLDQIMQIYHA